MQVGMLFPSNISFLAGLFQLAVEWSSRNDDMIMSNEFLGLSGLKKDLQCELIF
jgi:hypothetical protein